MSQIRAHVSHRFVLYETATYGGSDHIMLDESLVLGRIRREPGDPLCRRRASWATRGDWSHGLRPASDALSLHAGTESPSLSAGATSTFGAAINGSSSP